MDETAKGLSRPTPALVDEATKIDQPRRAMLRKLGRFVAVTPPAVTLLLSASAKPAQAAPSNAPSSRQFKERVSLPPSRRLAIDFG